MSGAGRDGHLPRRRLVAARSPRTPSQSGFTTSNPTRRGSSSSSRTGSSRSFPSSRTDPSDHSWDSPEWHPPHRRSLSPMTVLRITMPPPSPNSRWKSTPPSEKERRRSAAEAAAAAHRNRLDTMRYLDEHRHASLLFPPPRHSPEDYDRIYRLGIYSIGGKITREFSSAPDPYWCDEGYESSNQSEGFEDSLPPSPRFVKSDGGVSPYEPGFSIPFSITEGTAYTKERKKGRARVICGRKLFLDDADDEMLQSHTVYSDVSNGVISKSMDLIETRTLLWISIYNISYIRGLFLEKYFSDHLVPELDMKIKKLMPMDAESRRLIDWMEKGVYDALQKKYLKTLLFCICEKEEGPMIEEYDFSFSYPNINTEEVAMNMSRTGSKNGSTTFTSNASEVAPDQMRSSACKMISTLFSLMRTLDPMPEERTILMKLLYYDDVTPEDYEPPFFKGCADNEAINIWNKNPLKMEVGNVNSKHLVLALKVKSVLDPCDNNINSGGDGTSVDNEPYQDDDFSDTEVRPSEADRYIVAPNGKAVIHSESSNRKLLEIKKTLEGNEGEHMAIETNAEHVEPERKELLKDPEIRDGSTMGCLHSIGSDLTRTRELPAVQQNVWQSEQEASAMDNDPSRTPTSVLELAAPVCSLYSGVLGQKMRRSLTGGSEMQSTQDKRSRKASMVKELILQHVKHPNPQTRGSEGVSNGSS